MPQSFGMLPHFSPHFTHIHPSQLDDGMTSWNHTKASYPWPSRVPVDVLARSRWGLMHRGGFLTGPHVDAEGFTTVVEPENDPDETGPKVWIVVTVNPFSCSRRDVMHRHQQLVAEETSTASHSLFTYTAIIIRRGDIL